MAQAIVFNALRDMGVTAPRTRSAIKALVVDLYLNEEGTSERVIESEDDATFAVWYALTLAAHSPAQATMLRDAGFTVSDSFAQVRTPNGDWLEGD